MARDNPAEPVSEDVGIIVDEGEDGEVLIVLIDLPAFEYLVGQAPFGELWRHLTNPYAYVLGYLTMVDRVPYLQDRALRTGASEEDPWACGRTMEISAVGAQPGWGPLLYDVALGVAAEQGSDGVIPDRRSTTAAAGNVWLHYRTKRGDVDSADVPPGCPRIGAPYLNRAYRPNRAFPVELLRQFRDATTDKLEELAEGRPERPEELALHAERAGKALFVELFQAEVAARPRGGAVANPRRRRGTVAPDLRALKRRLMG